MCVFVELDAQIDWNAASAPVGLWDLPQTGETYTQMAYARVDGLLLQYSHALRTRLGLPATASVRLTLLDTRDLADMAAHHVAGVLVQSVSDARRVTSALVDLQDIAQPEDPTLDPDGWWMSVQAALAAYLVPLCTAHLDVRLESMYDTLSHQELLDAGRLAAADTEILASIDPTHALLHRDILTALDSGDLSGLVVAIEHAMASVLGRYTTAQMAQGHDLVARRSLMDIAAWSSVCSEDRMDAHLADME